MFHAVYTHFNRYSVVIWLVLLSASWQMLKKTYQHKTRLDFCFGKSKAALFCSEMMLPFKSAICILSEFSTAGIAAVWCIFIVLSADVTIAVVFT